jgi:hypothetical protein
VEAQQNVKQLYHLKRIIIVAIIPIWIRIDIGSGVCIDIGPGSVVCIRIGFNITSIEGAQYSKA